MNDKIKRFIEENTNKHLCACGCGEYIIIKLHHYEPKRGIPKYIPGHQSRVNHPMEGKHHTPEVCKIISKKATKQFENPKARERAREITIKQFEDPKARERHAKILTKYWEDPKLRKEMSQIKFKYYEDHPEVCENIREIQLKYNQNKRWNNQVDNLINGTPIIDWIAKPINNYGISQEDYEEWRNAVYERDNYTCQICSTNHCEVHTHHIIPQRINQDLILDINNGITMCRTCHELTYGKEEIYSEELQMIIDGVI